MSCRRASAALALAVMTFAAIAEDSAPQAPSPASSPAPSSAPDAAETAATQTSPADFRSKVYEYRSSGSDLRKPIGEITVYADKIEWEQAGVTRGAGNVRLSSDTMEIRGEVAELKQYDDGRLSQAHVTGDPVQLTDAATDTSPAITAHAKKADYDAKTSIVELTGNAVLTRGNDKITGENIRYDVAQRRVQASGGGSGQVKIVIQPATPKPSKAPAAAPETPTVQTEKKP